MAHYSYSQLSSFETCPQQYKFRSIDKAGLTVAPTAEIVLGQIVHGCLETLHRLAAEGIPFPKDKLLGQYHEEWEKKERRSVTVTNENMAVEDYIASGRVMLEKYYDTNAPFTDRKMLQAEAGHFFTLPGTSYQLYAKVDAFFKLQDNTYEICDFKTGAVPTQGIKDARFLLQMGIYQLALAEKFPDARPVTLVQHFLKTDFKLKKEFHNDELDELVEQIRLAIVAIREAIRLNNFPAREGGHCHFCAFQTICPAKRLRFGLKQESGLAGPERSTMERARDVTDKFIEVDSRIKELEAEKGALRDDLVQIAKDLNVSVFPGSVADLSVSVQNIEQFITKTADQEANADLNALARQLGFEDAFTLDENILYKEYYSKQRIPESAREALQRFLIMRERPRITRRKKSNEEPDD